MAESEKMTKIEKAWFSEPGACRSPSSAVIGSSSSLSFQSFGGLFIITGVASSLMLLVYLATFAYRERDELRAAEPTAGSGSTSLRKLRAWMQHYDRKDLRAPTFKTWNNESLRNGNESANRNPSPRWMGEGSQRNSATSPFSVSVRSEMNIASSVEETPASDVLDNFEQEEEGATTTSFEITQSPSFVHSG
jgi:hypothetical protein